MQKTSIDTDNRIFKLAVDLVNQSNRNIFLTGKAGTGKTTFLKYIREHSLKQIAVVAPTGVAAINAGGVTIHSFFNLPLEPFIPETQGMGFPGNNELVTNKHSLISRLRVNAEKRKVIRQLDVLVIDEISMVRCDTLDAIDTILRHIRQRPQEPFGGAQVLFIGDMFQLPPVIRNEEWRLLSDYYQSQYFFDSHVLRDKPPLYVEFKKIYRQRDEKFIDLLNQVRNNELDEYGHSLLESRFQPTVQRSAGDGYIVLTTHNNKADEINTVELLNLKGESQVYAAQVQDDFPDRAFPAQETLQLKLGAQVMFIRNDSADKGKRYFNGKIGTVSRLEKEKVFVQCEDEEEIEVTKEKWENIRYTLNAQTRQLEADVLGSFTQFPLRLAWAITIHKSQGLTFDKAIIDAGMAFAPGQAYVALSRCTTLDGVILLSHINPAGLRMDRKIIEFSQRSISAAQLESELSVAKNDFHQQELLSLFDFKTVLENMKEVSEHLKEFESSFNPESINWIDQLTEQTNTIKETADKFQRQLRSIFQQEEEISQSELLVKRIRAGAEYFGNAITALIEQIKRSPVATDSRQHSKEYNDTTKNNLGELAEKNFIFEGLTNGLNSEEILKRRKEFIMPSFSVNAYAGASDRIVTSPNPALHYKLRKLREQISSRKNLPLYMVASSNTIDEMSQYLPQTKEALKKVSGFGDARIQQYGESFLEIINEYCEANGLISSIDEKPGKQKKGSKSHVSSKSGRQKGESNAESLRLFRAGKTIAEIAASRQLVVGTVESHFLKYIQSGDINVEDLLSENKRIVIQQALEKSEGQGIVAVRQNIQEDVTFGEIRWVMADKARRQTPLPD